jgi:hypothetical protein
LEIAEGRPCHEVIALAGEVLPCQHHLHQRVMGQATGGVEPFHQHVEGHVLVLVGGQAALLHLRQQIDKSGVASRELPQIRPQHQRVDEEADELVERGITPPRDRNTDRHIGSGADLGK